MRHTATIVLMLLAAPAVRAVPPLPSAAFIDYCETYDANPEDADGLRCAIYIQGFLDGAVATDERVARNVAEEYERRESFTDRAARTRLGPVLARTSVSAYAEYCLGDPVPVQEVIERVLEFVRTHPSGGEMPARDLVYAALRTHYPCPK